MPKNVTIIGAGFMGGSITLALQDKIPNANITLFGFENDILCAKQIGIKNATSNFKKAIEHADICIIATPVKYMQNIVKDIIQYAKPGLIITDLGSTKHSLRKQLKPLLKNTKIKYVGSHPMAGSEKSGLVHANPNLFDNRSCIITTNPHKKHTKQVVKLWKKLGCSIHSIGSKRHDMHVAQTSHFPHVISALLTNTTLRGYNHYCVGQGFIDTTRIAKANVDMWTGITLNNKNNIIKLLKKNIHAQQEILKALKTDDKDTIENMFKIANKKRSKI